MEGFHPPCFECGYTRGHAQNCMQAILGAALSLDETTLLAGESLGPEAGGSRPKYLTMRNPAGPGMPRISTIEVAFRHVILLAPSVATSALRYEKLSRDSDVRKLVNKGEHVAMRGMVDVSHFKADRLEGPMLIESNIAVVSVRAGDKTEEFKDVPPLWAVRHRSFVDIRTVPKDAELEVIVKVRMNLLVEDLELALVGRAVRSITE